MESSEFDSFFSEAEGEHLQDLHYVSGQRAEKNSISNDQFEEFFEHKEISWN